MADTVSTSYKFNVVSNFNDGDTRSISIPDPITDTDELSTLIDNLQNVTIQKNILVGDKNNGVFTHFSDARIVEVTETNLDLS